MTNEYLQQAKAWLEKTGTRLDVVYLKTAKHWPSDTQARDVYTVQMVRGDKSHVFEFGDSINNTEANRNRGTRIKPNAYDILACIDGYEVADNIDDFAAEYGIEKPSEAIRSYEAIRKEYEALKVMYSEDELNELREIR